MAETYDVVAKVISQKGTCDIGHKVDDQWVIGDKTPEGICLFAYDTLHPCIVALKYGGAFPWESDSDITTMACPDAANPVVFELKRVRR